MLDADSKLISVDNFQNNQEALEQIQKKHLGCEIKTWCDDVILLHNIIGIHNDVLTAADANLNYLEMSLNNVQSITPINL